MILVTGHTGLVGGAVVEHLLERGYEVCGLSRRIAHDMRDVHQVEAALGSADFEEKVSGVSPCEHIIHCAADCDMRPGLASVVLTNCLGTQQVVSLARQWQSKSVVFTSSISVIGKPAQLPVTEEHPLQPMSQYSATKLFGERLMEQLAVAGTPAASLRLTAPVGPRMPRNRFLTILLQAAKDNFPLHVNGTGSRRQNYVDVRDIAAAAVACMERSVSGVFNLGGASSISNLELARRCVEILGSNSEIIVGDKPDPDDQLDWDICCDKAAKAFGYRAGFGIDDSIRTIAGAIG